MHISHSPKCELSRTLILILAHPNRLLNANSNSKQKVLPFSLPLLSLTSLESIFLLHEKLTKPTIKPKIKDIKTMGRQGKRREMKDERRNN